MSQQLITTISLFEATGRKISRWATALGDNKQQLKEELENFLRLVPEYRAMPAYLLLGMGDAVPDGFEPTKAYIYKFYSNTESISASMMLEDAGEFT